MAAISKPRLYLSCGMCGNSDFRLAVGDSKFGNRTVYFKRPYRLQSVWMGTLLRHRTQLEIQDTAGQRWRFDSLESTNKSEVELQRSTSSLATPLAGQHAWLFNQMNAFRGCANSGTTAEHEIYQRRKRNIVVTAVYVTSNQSSARCRWLGQLPRFLRGSARPVGPRLGESDGAALIAATLEAACTHNQSQ